MIEHPYIKKTWHVMGVSQAMAGKPVCEDSHCIERLEDDALAIAVADGAGTARLAQVGSMEASSAVAAYLRSAWESPPKDASCESLEKYVKGALFAARKALEDKAGQENIPLKDLATTLTLALVHGCYVAVAQVGDGLAVAEQESGEIITLTTPMRWEYVNETTMLTSDNALEVAQIYTYPVKIKRLGLLSDGLLEVTSLPPYYRPSERTYRSLFTAATRYTDQDTGEKAVADFLSSDRIQQSTKDDLTLVLAHRG